MKKLPFLLAAALALHAGQAAPQPVPFPLSASERANVTLAAGQPVGGTIVSARAQVCSLLPGPQTLDSGFVEQVLVEEGFAVTGPTEAAWANQQTRNKNRLIIGSEVATGAGYSGTALAAMGVISASGPAGAALVGGTLALRELSSFLKGQAPPDFATRYQNQPLMADNAKIKLNGAMDPEGGACAVQVVFIDLARTAKTLLAKKKIKATGNMKIKKVRAAAEIAPLGGTGTVTSDSRPNLTGPPEWAKQPVQVTSEVNIARSVWLSNLDK